MSRGILNSQKMKSNFAVIQRAIRRALPRDELDKKYIVEAGLKEANTMLNAFRTVSCCRDALYVKTKVQSTRKTFFVSLKYGSVHPTLT